MLNDATDDVAKMWIWGYYTSPIMYAMNAITVNEFLGHQWSKVNIKLILCVFVVFTLSYLTSEIILFLHSEVNSQLN